MGLDGVEFIMAVEEAFQIAIPDADAQQMFTPGDVVTYVYARVGSEGGHGCAEQRAFYRLRHASMKVFDHNWRLLHQATGTPH